MRLGVPNTMPRVGARAARFPIRSGKYLIGRRVEATARYKGKLFNVLGRGAVAC
jgi:hypothetical protein